MENNRYSIRNPRSTLNPKPRILDIVINHQGDLEIEVKGKKGLQRILLSDFNRQVEKIKKEQ